MTLILILCGAFGIACWIAFTRYPLENPRPPAIRATTSDDWSLAIHVRRAPDRKFREPVLLCHGLGNNHTIFDFDAPVSLAQHLSLAGFDCYSVDLRGAGASPMPNSGPYDIAFDNYVASDVPALIAAILADSGAQRLLWIGHSLGGLIGLAASTGPLASRFAGLCTIGSPVYLESSRKSLFELTLGQWLAPWGVLNVPALRYLAPLTGRIPGPRYLKSANVDNLDMLVQRKLLDNTLAPVFRGVLAQIRDWVARGAFCSVDGTIDYRARLARLRCPLLVVGGTIDGLAPERTTRQYFDGLFNSQRELAMFGRAYGHSVDYGHGDLLVGRTACLDVYPVIARALCAMVSAPAIPLAIPLTSTLHV